MDPRHRKIEQLEAIKLSEKNRNKNKLASSGPT